MNRNEMCDICDETDHTIVKAIHDENEEDNIPPSVCRSNSNICLKCWVEYYNNRTFQCPCGINCNAWLESLINDENEYTTEIESINREILAEDQAEFHPLRELVYIISENSIGTYQAEYIRNTHSSKFNDIIANMKTIDISLTNSNIEDPIARRNLTLNNLRLIREYGYELDELIMRDCDIINLNSLADGEQFRDIIKLDMSHNPLESLDSLQRLFSNISEINIDNTNITNLSTLDNVSIQMISAKNCDIVLRSSPLPDLLYLDIRFNERFDREHIDYQGMFPSLIVLKTDTPTWDNWEYGYMLTDDDKRVLSTYNREDPETDHIFWDCNENDEFDFDPRILNVKVIDLEGYQFDGDDLVTLIKLISFGFFHSLTSFHVLDCGIDNRQWGVILAEPYTCEHLTSVCFTGGELTDISEIEQIFPNVKELTVARTKLAEFPDVSTLRYLQKLELADNRIMIIANEQIILPNNKMVIDLVGNQIESIAPFFDYINNIILEVDGNGILDIMSDLRLNADDIRSNDRDVINGIIDTVWHVKGINEIPNNDELIEFVNRHHKKILKIQENLFWRIIRLVRND
jgi:Leucine-rich repeat (LRR) protein